MLAQLTTTVVTLDPEIVPEPPLTVQASPAGCVLTVTLYVAPLVSAAGNVNAPLALTVTGSAPLFCRISPVDVRPDTVPPTV